MIIPVSKAGRPAKDELADRERLPESMLACQWTKLDAGAKRERLLYAAAEVFAAEGIDASMPAVAVAAGAGVASVYRQFPSKRELVAALVVRRLNQIAQEAAQTAESAGDRFSALKEMLWKIVERQAYDDFPDVEAATERASAALERLLVAARAEGRLRPDASSLDLRLLFAATRAAKQVEPAAWRRTLELFIDALQHDPQA
jgi:AcrR family transcriptional regulator